MLTGILMEFGANQNHAAAPFVDHCVVTRDVPANEGVIRLPSNDQMNSGKLSQDVCLQRWYFNACKVHG